HVQDVGGLLPVDFSVAHHSSERDGQRLACRLILDPSNLFPIELGSPGSKIGAVKNLVGVPLEPIPHYNAERSRRKQPCLFRQIRIYVWLTEQVRNFPAEGLRTAVNEDKRCLPKSRIVNQRTEKRGIRAGKVEIASTPATCMKVHGHAEAAGFRRHISKQIILQSQIFLVR